MRARDEARRAAPGQNRRIIVGGGAYYGVSTVLEREDSGLTIEAAPGERPFLYGGYPVTGWRSDGEFVASPLSAARDGCLGFRVLIVNGEWRPRARLPERGEYEHLNEFPLRWLSTAGGEWEREPTYDELTILQYKEGDLGPWLDLRSAELTIFHAWDESLVGIRSLDPVNHTALFSVPAGHPPGAFGGWVPRAKTYVVWNTREGMHTPGQWYLDKTNGKLVYWPRNGEDASNLDVIAPVIETVINIEEGASGITLRGLTISATTTALVVGGFGAANYGGAIVGTNIANSCFEDLVIENVGGWGLKLCGQNLHVESCKVRKTGAGGMVIRGRDNVVSNNELSDVGMVYPSAIAIMLEGEKNMLVHNAVRGTPYSAIVCSGDDSVIESNIVEDVMKVLSDGAGIYLTFCRRIAVTGNVVRGSDGGQRVYAYYLDEWADDCRLESNIALNSGWPAHSHMARRCLVRNNAFIDRGHQAVSFPRSQGINLERNIFVANEIVLAKPAGNAVTVGENIFFSRTGKVVFEELEGYEVKTRTLQGPATGLVLGDPLLQWRSNRGFEFQPGSPAFSLGIKPLDLSCAGPQPPTRLVDQKRASE